MTGEIIKIEEKKSKNGGKYYFILFRLEDGKTALTYLVPKHRNFKRWKPYLKVGTILENLRLKNGIVDGDSFIRPYKEEILAKLGVFG